MKYVYCLSGTRTIVLRVYFVCPCQDWHDGDRSNDNNILPWSGLRGHVWGIGKQQRQEDKLTGVLARIVLRVREECGRATLSIIHASSSKAQEIFLNYM
jgi:hypothetical protein